MRSLGVALVLAMAAALVFGTAIKAQAASFPYEIESLEEFLSGASYTTPTVDPTQKWLFTALAYEAGYTIDLYGPGNQLFFTNRTNLTPNPFGTWFEGSGEESDYSLYIRDTGETIIYSSANPRFEYWQLTADWTYEALGLWLPAGSIVFGFDDLGGGPDDNHDDFIFAFKPVPVPAAVWLLGSGLVGLAGLRRKFKN